MPTVTESAEFQKFLDTVQYSKDGILKYEMIFGDGFISTGGPTTTLHLCEKYLDGKIAENPRILDVGCGIGGGCAFLAERYNGHVIGIDLSSNVINIAKERYAGHRNLEFKIEDALLSEYKAGEFDLIYSRDALLHVAEKAKLFKLFYKWLKPGGIVLITDYCCGEPQYLHDQFKAYVAQRGYHLLTVPKYEKILIDAGLNAKGENITDWFRNILKIEKNRLLEPKISTRFLEKYSQEEMDKLIAGWDDKLKTTAENCHVWGVFQATKD